MPTIILNGEPRDVPCGSVRDLILSLALDPDRVAVERNRAIVPRSTHGSVAIAEGDEIEIVHFVGGGC